MGRWVCLYTSSYLIFYTAMINSIIIKKDTVWNYFIHNTHETHPIVSSIFEFSTKLLGGEGLEV